MLFSGEAAELGLLRKPVAVMPWLERLPGNRGALVWSATCGILVLPASSTASVASSFLPSTLPLDGQRGSVGLGEVEAPVAALPGAALLAAAASEPLTGDDAVEAGGVGDVPTLEQSAAEGKRKEDEDVSREASSLTRKDG